MRRKCSNTADCLERCLLICSQFAAIRMLNAITYLLCSIYLSLMRQDSTSITLGSTISAARLTGHESQELPRVTSKRG